MTQTVSRTSSASIALNPRLQALIDHGNLDMNDPRHREAFLKAWVNAPREQEDADDSR